MVKTLNYRYYIVVLLIGLILIMNAYHSFDLINNYPNCSSHDKTISGKILDINQILINAKVQLILGILFMIYGGIKCFHTSKMNIKN